MRAVCDVISGQKFKQLAHSWTEESLLGNEISSIQKFGYGFIISFYNFDLRYF